MFKIFFSRLVVQRSILSVLTRLKHGCWINLGVCMPLDHPLVHTNSGNRSLWLSSSVIGWNTLWLIARLLRSWCSAWSRSMERFAPTLIILLVLWVSAFTIIVIYLLLLCCKMFDGNWPYRSYGTYNIKSIIVKKWPIIKQVLHFGHRLSCIFFLYYPRSAQKYFVVHA